MVAHRDEHNMSKQVERIDNECTNDDHTDCDCDLKIGRLLFDANDLLDRQNAKGAELQKELDAVKAGAAKAEGAGGSASAGGAAAGGNDPLMLKMFEQQQKVLEQIQQRLEGMEKQEKEREQRREQRRQQQQQQQSPPPSRVDQQQVMHMLALLHHRTHSYCIPAGDPVTRNAGSSGEHRSR
jgi:hypothetical protein